MHLNESTRLRERRERLPELMVEEERERKVLKPPNGRRGAKRAGGGLPGGDFGRRRRQGEGRNGWGSGVEEVE